ncbi:MAG: hypothetical protein JAZ15_11785 [Candidatus Thiodiazotropha endolucinida]|nr:hypothetical protein [Candidatus Thiodiazotropha taylori]MCW4313702.1 hypothetical protein [Candidatus Thiodiazotropha taylori]
MKLHDIISTEEISSKFDAGVKGVHLGLNQIEEIVTRSPNTLFEIGAQAWMLYVESGAKVDPYILSYDFDNSNPFLFEKVGKIIKRKIIQDISFSYVKVNDISLERNTCCLLHLCRMWPNDLFIADVEFSNPYQTVSTEEQKYQFHEYRSLGLFSNHFERMIQFARSNHIGRITLSTATNDQISYFEKYGFVIENNNFAKQAKELGLGVPMYKTM